MNATDWPNRSRFETVKPRGWTALDAGNALIEAERACVGIYGPILTRTTDGWECTAVIVNGRRMRQHVTSGVVPTPDAALERLAEQVRLVRDGEPVTESEDRVMDGNR